MPVTLDRNGVAPMVPLTAAGRLRPNTFMTALRAGQRPREAARKAGDTAGRECGHARVRQGQLRQVGGHT